MTSLSSPFALMSVYRVIGEENKGMKLQTFREQLLVSMRKTRKIGEKNLL